MRDDKATHGTRIAGQLVMRPNNEVCGVGIIFGARFAGTFPPYALLI